MELEERKCKCGRIFTPTISINQMVCATCGLKNLMEFINMRTFGAPHPKFRAWDEGNKVMHHDFEFITSGKDGKTDGSDWIVFKSDKQPLSGKPHPFENPFFAQQLKIMQWTGNVDDNLKDIYDGDIMEGEDDEPINEYESKKIILRCRVKWDLDNAKWIVEDLYDGSIEELNDYIGAQRVIGNVYETPGLVPGLGEALNDVTETP